MRTLEVFHLACVFELKVPELRRAELQQLIASINELLWVGHFRSSLRPFDNVRSCSELRSISANAIFQLFNMAANQQEGLAKYHCAVRRVLADRSANEAIAAVTFETAGEA